MRRVVQRPPARLFVPAFITPPFVPRNLTTLEFCCRTMTPIRSASRQASAAGPGQPTRSAAIPC